ncbi:MAG: ABC-type transporter, integral rane subunit [Gemmatimonadetes bacterium]|jgi:simple sugar transport system permease protein|nr:ABC-type transporter, integral rane subunit [Gemmatimonadota bacterium]
MSISGPAMAPVGDTPSPASTSASSNRVSRRSALEEAILPPLVALLLAAVVGDLLILAFGESPGAVFRLLLDGTWGNPYGFGQVLYKATTLVFTGLAVGLGLRAGLFNIGAESQLAAGGFAAALVGLLLPAGIPALLCLPIYLLAAAIGGGAVGAVPGVLKARFGAHEVIVTIMLNFIVLALLNYLVSARLAVPDTLHTPELQSGALPRFADVLPAFQGSAANVVIVLAIVTAVAFGWFLFRTRAGFELRAVGLQPQAAEAAGVNVASVTWRALAISGAIAGLGGLNYVLGYKHYYEEGFATGAGFLGIAVALVGRNHPVGIVLAALLFATLSQGGLAVNALVPKQMVDVLQAVVIIAVATSVPEVRRLLRSTRRSVER